MGNVVMRGEEKYQEIYLMNVNQNITIESGCLAANYCVMGQNGETIMFFYLKNAIYQPAAPNLEELDGSILLIRKDYLKFPQTIEEDLKNQSIDLEEGMVFQPYLFIFYEFVCEGKELSGYNKVEIKGEGCGRVEELKDPENYFDVYEIDL